MLISFSLILENLVDYLLKESKLPQVCWENGRKGDLMHIPFDGVPFVLLSTREYQCHQGKDRRFKKSAKELQRRALEYVIESLFSGESHPDATRRKFR